MSTLFRYYLVKKKESRDKAFYIGYTVAASISAALTAIAALSVPGYDSASDQTVLEEVPDSRYSLMTPFNQTATAVDVQLLAAAAGKRLQRIKITETAAAAATIHIRLGTTSSGTSIEGLLTFAANEVKEINYDPYGVDISTGLFLDRVTGTVSVTGLANTQL